jgi:transcription antitermination factor NusG
MTGEATTGEWYAVYTRHQHEKTAARLLAEKGFEVLLPLYQVPHRWKDRTQVVSLPLFPSYAFVRAHRTSKVEILSTAGVCQLVGNSQGPIPIPDSEMESVRRLSEKGGSLRPYPFLKCGDRVRICNGPLAGIEGILVRVRNQFRVVLSVDLLQQSVAVEADLSTLTRISRPCRDDLIRPQ